MSDSRTFKITMTVAQYDVMKAAMEQVLAEWKVLGIIRSSDRLTLMRAMGHISKEFEQGTKA